MSDQPTLLDPAFRAKVEELSSALEDYSRERDALHAGMLSRVADLTVEYEAAGWSVGLTAELALLLRVSEFRARALIDQAELLGGLQGGFAELAAGRLTIDTVGVLVELLMPLEPEVRARVWAALQARLAEDERSGVVRVGGRFREWLRRQVIKADPAGATERREEAQAKRRVTYRRHPDGTGDLSAFGITGPSLQAVLRRIDGRAEKLADWDTRTADQRRCDALVDLLLGRDRLDLGDGACSTSSGQPCGCRLGEPVPCGAQMQVLLPIGAGLGTTGELAELVGHGPLEPDLLDRLLANAPVLHPAWVDEHGVLVATGKPVTVPRWDRQAVHDALLSMARQPPPPRETWLPRHQHDHPHPAPPAPSDGQAASGHAADGQAADGRAADGQPADGQVDDGQVDGGQVDGGQVDGGQTPDGLAADGPVTVAEPGGHPPGTPGPYRPPRWMRRVLKFRSPRCEWPGCGARSVRCDLDHDTAYDATDPDGGPTCGCNLGPLCRRHHRVKQLGWTKQRIGADATGAGMTVRWTSRLSRTSTTPSQLPVPEPPLRAPAPPAEPALEDTMSADEFERLMMDIDPADPWFDEWEGEDSLPDETPAPDDEDLFRRFLLRGDGTWSYDLDDDVLWLDPTFL